MDVDINQPILINQIELEILDELRRIHGIHGTHGFRENHEKRRICQNKGNAKKTLLRLGLKKLQMEDHDFLERWWMGEVDLYVAELSEFWYAKQHDAPTVHGFHVLPIIFPAVPSLPSTATHYLYITAHDPQISTENSTRSIFLANVPIDATDAHIRHLFTSQLGLPHGRIEAVSFEKQRNNQAARNGNLQADFKETKGKKRKRGSSQRPIQVLEDSNLPSTWDRDIQVNGGSAIVIFVDVASSDTVLRTVAKAIKNSREIVWGEGLNVVVPALGSARYLNHAKLQYPDKSTLLQSVNAYMTAYAAQEAAHTRLSARQRSEPDEDGFVTVTRGGRVDPAKQDAAQANAAKHNERKVDLEDFYRFQTREKKKARAGELIRKFEEDKEKIRRMKERNGRSQPE